MFTHFAMSTQQDIYVVGAENRSSMLNKDNYIPWSSRLLRSAKSKSNRKLLLNSILEGLYQYRMIEEPSDPYRIPHVLPSSYLQTDDKLTTEEAKQVEADDQAIQTILTGLPEDIYATVDSCNSTKEIWLHVQQMMKGPVWGCDRLVLRAKVIENQVMAISVISVSSDSSEDSVGTPAGRVILFDTIPTTIPDTTPVIAPLTTQTDTTRVGPLAIQQLAVRHSVDHSSSDSSSTHSLSDHSSLDLPSTSAGPSRKRRRSPMTSVPALPPVSRALSPVRADLIRLPTRVRDIGYLVDAKVGPRETRVERVTHPAMPEDILEPAQEGAEEVTYETLGDLVQRFHDHIQAIPVHRVLVIEGVQWEQGHMIVGVESAVTALTERVAELERDNKRLRGTASDESQRVDRLQCDMSPKEMEAREAARNLETLNENEDDQESKNGGNENGGNRRNGNIDNEGNENGGNRGNENEGNGKKGIMA
nr:hypothetical protein [Tanacetum cinerariifolium]